MADAMYISFMKDNFPGDSRFLEFDERDWDVVGRRDHEGFEFVRYRRGT